MRRQEDDGSRNTVSGDTSGIVVQTGTVQGDVTIQQIHRDLNIAERDLHLYYVDVVRAARRSEPGAGPEQCPYPGLAAFDAQQAQWFFGRDALTADLLVRLDERLWDGGALAVIAPSGAGKSSLLRAGVLPAIARGALPVAGSARWPCAVFTPTARPLAAMASQLARIAGSSPKRAAEVVADGPTACVALLREALREEPDGDEGAHRRWVVVVDQLEELFTLCPSEQERRDFLDLLGALAGAGLGGEGPAGLVVYGLRSDFYTLCADYPQLRVVLQDSPVVVGPMSESDMRQAILFPAKDVGLEIEPGLIEVLLRDLGASAHLDTTGGPTGAGDPGGHGAGRLPLLAHALRATWQRRHGHILTVDGYRDTGGIAHSVATTAERHYARLNPADQRTARTLFLRLVKIGDGVEDTRRQITVADLLGRSEGAPADAAIIETFTQARLLTREHDSVEITHEVLLRAWPRLRHWIEADQVGNLIRQELEEVAAGWGYAGHDAGLLYSTWRHRQPQSEHGVLRVVCQVSFAGAGRPEHGKISRMAVELDPGRLFLHDELRRSVLPWIVSKAFEMSEIQEGVEQSGLAPAVLTERVFEAGHVVITVGPEFEAVYQLAGGKDARIDTARLAKELRRSQWPIRWGTYYETRTGEAKPETLYEALSDWCTVVLRDGVVPELRRAINEQISGEFSTTLRIGADPGLRQANDVSFAVVTRSTKRFLEAIARTHANGAIGLAGPRGAGKSTLIQHYVSGLHGSGRGPAPVVVSVACPVHYEARDFVLHLHATLCRAVLHRVEPRKSVRRQPGKAFVKYAVSVIARLVCGFVVAAAALVPMVSVDPTRPIVPQLVYPATQFAWWMIPFMLVVAYTVVIVAGVVLSVLRTLVTVARALPLWSRAALLRVFEWSAHPVGRRDSVSATDALGQVARMHQRQIRMLQTSTTGWSGRLTLPLAPEAAATKSIQLAERPLTYPEVVDAFRDFIIQCIEVLGSVVIAIDEVDKIASPEHAQAFINDIKGIFGVAGCLYLVSISEDALVTFERTGLGIRDAFDSAFDEIVPVEYLTLADSLELLSSRVIGISEPFGFLCHCLSGGLPRELIRAVRRVAEHRATPQPTSLATICGELVRDELAARAYQFRIVANRLSVHHGTAVLEPLIHLPRDPSAKDLLDLTTNLIRRQVSDSTPPTLNRLRREAAMLAYHSATLKQVFTNELAENKAERARDDPAFPGSFDQLSRARTAVTEDPHLAGLLLDEFRDAWNLPTPPGR